MPTLGAIARAWGRIGIVGFGGPPAHIALLRELVVDRRRWMRPEQFEDGLAAVNLLPGPASTQLAIFTAWRTGGPAAAVVGGLAFIVPGLVLIVALAALFLGSPPDWIRGAGAGAGAAVAAVAIHAGLLLIRPAWSRAAADIRWRFVVYTVLGGVSAATLGPWLVAVLVACGVVEVGWRRLGGGGLSISPHAALALVAASGGTMASLAWVAFKVGALSYGGGFVIIPLMQADAVERYGWMTDAEFLNAVALGQVTPGPVVHTVAVVGYAAAGVPGAALASWSLSLRPSRSSSSARGASTVSWRTGTCARSSTVPAPLRSARSSARPSRWRSRWGRPGSGQCSPVRLWLFSSSAAESSSRCSPRGWSARSPWCSARPSTRDYRPEVPVSPLNGPTMSEVIQPP